MKKRKKISLILGIIVTVTIVITVPIIRTNEKIYYCEKKEDSSIKNNINDTETIHKLGGNNIDNTETTYELAVSVCGSDNKRYGTARSACEVGVKYYGNNCPRTSILQLIIDNIKN